jgi:hypothetical protein
VAQSASITLPDAQIESNVLKALASAPELSTQNIQSSTVYGTVTLTGNVQTEALRTTAENLAARAQGVQKVVDELTLGDTPPPQAQNQNGPPDQGGAPGNYQQGMDQSGAGQNSQMFLQSDGTYAPAQNSDAAPPQDQQQDQQQMQDGAAPPPPPQGYPSDQGAPPDGRQPMNQGYGQPPAQGPIPGGQPAGLAVTVPPGSMLRIRINEGFDSNHVRVGAPFDGTVVTDVVAGGYVAIPRGAEVSGVVVGAKKAGTFKGEGELSLQVNNVTLGGQVYPLTTEVWAHTGRDKEPGTVTNTVGLGAFGALLGAAAGGGAGAAIGAGVGAGAGLAGSAASPRGQIVIPPESVLTFRIATPTPIRTVSEQEIQRLSYQAGPAQPAGPPRVRYYSPYYGYYYGPPR